MDAYKDIALNSKENLREHTDSCDVSAISDASIAFKFSEMSFEEYMISEEERDAIQYEVIDIMNDFKKDCSCSHI